MDSLVLYEKIGNGYQSTIYRGLWNNQEVAIKVTNDTDSHKNEVDILSKLDHPNIIKLLDYDDKYIVLPLLSKINISDNHDIKRFCKEMIDTLLYLNENNIVHYDIHLRNIMKEGDKYILCDFGISEYSDKKEKWYPKNPFFTGIGDPLFKFGLDIPDLWDLILSIIELHNINIDDLLSTDRYRKLIDKFDDYLDMNNVLPCSKDDIPEELEDIIKDIDKELMIIIDRVIENVDKNLQDLIKRSISFQNRITISELISHPYLF